MLAWPKLSVFPKGGLYSQKLSFQVVKIEDCFPRSRLPRRRILQNIVAITKNNNHLGEVNNPNSRHYSLKDSNGKLLAKYQCKTGSQISEFNSLISCSRLKYELLVIQFGRITRDKLYLHYCCRFLYHINIYFPCKYL